jgi:hypothetical protein
VFQGTFSPIIKNQGLFIRRSRQNINGVNGNKVKMCASIMEFGRGGNNVHFISKHVSRNEFWVHTSSLGFWVKLGFARWYEAIDFLQDWTNYVLAKVCTKLQTLQQRVQRDEANMEKDHT